MLSSILYYIILYYIKFRELAAIVPFTACHLIAPPPPPASYLPVIIQFTAVDFCIVHVVSEMLQTGCGASCCVS